jgi:hypothetical protein
VDLDKIVNERQAETAGTIASLGVTDILLSFRQRKWRDRHTWRKFQSGSWRYSRCDYILAENRDDFQNVCTLTPRQFTSDHLLVRGDLVLGAPHTNPGYEKSRRRYFLHIAPAARTETDKLIQDLKERFVTARPKQNTRRNSWISLETWELIDRKALLRRTGAYDNDMLKSLTQDIWRQLRRDRRERIRKVGDEIEGHLEQNRTKEAYGLLKRWYHKATGRPLKPTREDLDKVSDDFEHLFSHRPPPGEDLPIHVEPFPIPDTIPDEDEIGGAIMRLKNGKSPGATGMRAEDLKRWYTNREGQPEPWEKLVSIIQTTFHTGEIPFVIPHCILALIPKSDSSQMRGIGLMEIIWKTITKIMNDRINENVKFHDGLHGCVPGRGTGTALIETKLAMQLAQRDSRPWYQIFLDLTKAFDSIDRERLLKVLAQYGVGPRIIRLLRNFWGKHLYVPRQSKYYGRHFKGEHGTTQGDVISGTLFNILIDAIIRHWYEEVSLIETVGIARTDTHLMWYVDDSKLSGHDPLVIQ